MQLCLPIFAAIFIRMCEGIELDDGSGMDDLLSADSTILLEEGSGDSNAHTVYPPEDLLSSSDTQCKSSSLSAAQRHEILTTHNNLRSLLAFGKQKNKVGMMPSGRNIYKLSWDCEMERKVRDHIRGCNSTYMPPQPLRSDSNLFKVFWLYWDGYDHSKNIRTALKEWWSEGAKSGNMDSRNRYFSIRNYYGWANMAKGKTTTMACSYSVCEMEKKSVFSCLYNERAQCERETIYETGKPCEFDEDCFTYPGSTCLEEEGLCQAPQREKDYMRSEICEDNSKMTDAIRKVAVEQHNFYRSRLALGLEFNGETNTSQVRAKRMTYMEYDCRLERYAQDWADNCLFAHSDHWKRPNQGQNLYMTSFIQSDPRSLLHTAMEKWWQELEEFGVPQDNILSSTVWAKKGGQVGHWTQMAWDRSYRLGCAIANCPTMGFVVCHYGPSGNRRNHEIYEVGNPCVFDSECPTGFYCLRLKGLCAVKK